MTSRTPAKCASRVVMCLTTVAVRSNSHVASTGCGFRRGAHGFRHDRPSSPVVDWQRQNGGGVYYLEENNWTPLPTHDAVRRPWREGRTSRTRALPRSSLPDRWRLNCRLLGRRRPPESGPKFPPATSPTSTITSTARRKRSEAGLRGYALLGRCASSTRFV